MNRLFTIFAALLLLCGTSACQSTNYVATNDVVRLRVTLLDSALLRSFTGTLTRTSDFDPRFALTVRIVSCVPAISHLKSGTVVTFAVHSPSMFLGGDAKNGKTYEIMMTRKRATNL